MIEFIINGVKAVLPEGFSFKMTEENPYITKRGEFSLDIDFSIESKVNARIFEHVYRLNKIAIGKSYPAELRYGFKKSIGTIIVISNTDKTVTVQFVAGKSEANYLIGNEKKIWDFDWGSETAISFTTAKNSALTPSYTNKFVCVPVKLTDKTINNYLTKNYASGFTGPDYYSIYDCENIVMQPYLLYYINKLPELLGFTLGTNILNNDEKCNKMYLVNHIKSLNYSDILPDISVGEFISAVEGMFNVIFTFNSTTKEVDIISQKNNYSQRTIVKLTNVIDTYQREAIDETESFQNAFTYINYEMNDSGYNKYAKLDEEIKKNCTIRSYSSLTNLINSLNTSDLDKYIIYKDTSTSFCYVYISVPTINVFGYTSDGRYLVLVDRFRDYGTDQSKILTIKIQPAEITTIKLVKEYREYGVGNNLFVDCYYQLPKLDKYIFIPTTLPLKNAIESDILNIDRNDRLIVAMYNGMLRVEMFKTQFEYWSGVIHEDYYKQYFDYPHSFIDDIPYFGNSYCGDNTTFSFWYVSEFQYICNQTIKLFGSNGIFETYHNDGDIIDSSYEYEFTLPDSEDLKVDNLFEYNNQIYVPIRFERNMSAKKRMIKGYFYKLK